MTSHSPEERRLNSSPPTPTPAMGITVGHRPWGPRRGWTSLGSSQRQSSRSPRGRRARRWGAEQELTGAEIGSAATRLESSVRATGLLLYLRSAGLAPSGGGARSAPWGGGATGQGRAERRDRGGGLANSPAAVAARPGEVGRQTRLAGVASRMTRSSETENEMNRKRQSHMSVSKKRHQTDASDRWTKQIGRPANWVRQAFKSPEQHIIITRVPVVQGSWRFFWTSGPS